MSSSRPPSYNEGAATINIATPSPTYTPLDQAVTVIPNPRPTFDASTKITTYRQPQAQQQQTRSPPRHKRCCCSDLLCTFLACLIVAGTIFPMAYDIRRRHQSGEICFAWEDDCFAARDNHTSTVSTSLASIPTETVAESGILSTVPALSEVMKTTSTASPTTATKLGMDRREQGSCTTFATITREAVLAGRTGL